MTLGRCWRRRRSLRGPRLRSAIHVRDYPADLRPAGLRQSAGLVGVGTSAVRMCWCVCGGWVDVLAAYKVSRLTIVRDAAVDCTSREFSGAAFRRAEKKRGPGGIGEHGDVMRGGYRAAWVKYSVGRARLTETLRERACDSDRFHSSLCIRRRPRPLEFDRMCWISRPRSGCSDAGRGVSSTVALSADGTRKSW